MSKSKYRGGMIGGALNRKTEPNPADWTNTNIAEDYSYIIPVPTAELGTTIVGYENKGFGNIEGSTVAISGDGLTAVVSAQTARIGTDTGAGAVFIYEWDVTNNKWLQPFLTPLRASDYDTSDYFGSSVAIDSDGSTIAVGAYLEDTGGSNAGKVYIFEKGAGWSPNSANQVAMLRTSSDSVDTKVGRSLALSADGQTLLVGGYGRFTNTGEAFIFEKPSGGWVNDTGTPTQQAILTASDGSQIDQFGITVALSADGSTALIGANGVDGVESSTGAAYIFERPGAFGSWSNTTEDAILTASDAATGTFSLHGLCVSSDGSTAYVGNYSADGGDVSYSFNQANGAVYIFEKPGGGWVDATENVILLPEIKNNNAKFGISIDISADDNTLVVGARGTYYNNDKNNTHNRNAGAVYIFEKGAGWVDTPTNKTVLLRSPIVEHPKSTSTFHELGYVVSISADASRIIASGDEMAIAYHKPDVATNDATTRVISNDGMLDLNSAGAQENIVKLAGYSKTDILIPAVNGTNRNIGLYSQALAISDDNLTAVIGVPAIGQAFVYTFSNGSWSLTATLTGSNTNTFSSFAQSVAFSGDNQTIIIGASDVGNTGAVYVYEKPGGGWVDATEDAYLHPASSSSGHSGKSVCITHDGTTIFSGAFEEHVGGTANAGAVYVFEKGAGWSTGSSNQAASLYSNAPQTNGNLGYAVKCSGDGTTLAVSAGFEDNNNITRAGAVYVFEKGAGWSNGSSNQSARLTASSSYENDYLGNITSNEGTLALSDDGNTVVAGAGYANIVTSGEGKAYIFEKPAGGWVDATEDHVLFDGPESPTSGIDNFSTRFGHSVAISKNGENIFVGARYAHVINNNNNNEIDTISGTIYVFEKGNGWKSKLGSLTNVVVDSSDVVGQKGTFGTALACSPDGNILFVGIHNDDTTGNNNGRVDVFTFTDNVKEEKRVLSRSSFGGIVGNNKFDIPMRAVPGSSDWANNPKDFHEHDLSTNTAAGTHLGYSTALSYDGTRYVIAAEDNDTFVIMDFVNGKWRINDQIVSNAGFGRDVAISDDGNTIVVVKYIDSSVAVYEYINNQWKESAELTSSTSATDFGISVDISGDGKTVIASSLENSGRGAVFVYEKPLTGWTDTTEDGILQASDGGPSTSLSIYTSYVRQLAVTKDGSTIIATASGAGAIYVFNRTGSFGTWSNSTEIAKLTVTYGGRDGVDISGDGNTIISSSTVADKVYIFEKSADSDWTDSTASLYIENGSLTADGSAISDDGNTIAFYSDQVVSITDAASLYHYGSMAIYEKGSGWVTGSTNKVRRLLHWHTENEATRRTACISGDGTVCAVGTPNYDRLGTDKGGSYLRDSKKYEEIPVMNKTGMFSLKDMYQSKLTES